MKKCRVPLVCLVLVLCFAIGNTSFAKQSDEELARIASYKLFSSADFKDMEQPVTDKMFYSAIKNYIKPYGKKCQKKFDAQVKSSLTDGNPLTYQDVFFLTFLTAYATDTTRLTQTNTSEHYYFHDKGVKDYWESERKYNEKYAKPNEENYYYYRAPWGEKQRWTLDAATMFFNRLQTSQLSGAALFTPTTTSDLSFFFSNCPKDVAIRMLGRLYESAKQVKWDLNSTDAKAIYNKAAERKRAILDSPSEYTAKGKVYYVSTSGNDDNDGLSEGTPWKTLQRVSYGIEPGSVVLLKRGDIWRGESLFACEGVTYL